MDKETFAAIMKPVIDCISGQQINQQLAKDLNSKFPASGETFKIIDQACHRAIKAGWMCKHGDAGRKFGRVIKPSPDSNNLSIDVVQLRDVIGPHHSHPKGEICLTLPVTKGAKFDGLGAGWCVNDPGSAHSPTVTDGEALVLYLLPGGEINFS